MKQHNHIYVVLTCIVWMMACLACQRPSTPRPYGYFRIHLPEHSYHRVQLNGYPYSFEIADIAKLQPICEQGEKYWINIVYPNYNATIHCSYKPLHNDLGILTNDAMEFVFSHACKASAIPERFYTNPDAKVYGLTFDLEGQTATPMQFYLTDSVHHFLRGALYFNNVPNQDSLAPVTDYIQEDILHLVETMQWTR